MAKVSTLETRTVGDTGYPLDAYLTDRKGAVVLTGATVALDMRRADGTVKCSGAMTVTGPGYVRYAWQAADVNEAGTFHVRIKVTFPGALVYTFPPNGYGELTFVPASP